MCMKGGGGQPLEAVGQALSDEQQSTEQSTVMYTHSIHTVSCFTPCERVSLDRLHADNLLTTQLVLVDGSRVLRRAV